MLQPISQSAKTRSNAETCSIGLCRNLEQSNTKPPLKPVKICPNASLDTFPHNSNLFQWKKQQSACCLLCKGDQQNLIHILNSCKRALEPHRYERHDMVLDVIANAIKCVLPTTMKMSADAGEGYIFPFPRIYGLTSHCGMTPLSQ